jgi:hypothetical protein
MGLLLPIFFFKPLDLEMTGITITTFDTDMQSPFVTVYAFFVLRSYTICGEILVHDLV